MLKKQILRLMILSMLMGVLSVNTGCTKEEEVVTEATYYTVCSEEPSSEMLSAEDKVLEYIRLIRTGETEEAYKMIKVGTDLFTYSTYQMTGVIEEIQSIGDRTLYSIQNTGGSIKLLYGIKTGEKYSELTRKEKKQGVEPTYLGDYIADIVEIEVYVTLDEENNWHISMPESQFSDEVIALKVPKGVRVYVGDVLLDSRLRDDYGFYLITDFLAMDTLKVTLETDIEIKDIELDITPPPAPIQMTDTSGNIYYDTSNIIPKENSTEHPEGYMAFDYTDWQCFRQTEEDACDWLKVALQVVYSSYQKQQKDIYTSDLAQIFSKSANIEEIKPYYAKYISNYEPTKTRRYTDCTIIDVTQVDEKVMTKKEQSNKIVDVSTMWLYVNIEYSYFIEQIDSETKEVISRNIRSGVIENVKVSLTQDEGKWRLVDIEKKFFTGLA